MDIRFRLYNSEKFNMTGSLKMVDMISQNKDEISLKMSVENSQKNRVQKGTGRHIAKSLLKKHPNRTTLKSDHVLK